MQRLLKCMLLLICFVGLAVFLVFGARLYKHQRQIVQHRMSCTANLIQLSAEKDLYVMENGLTNGAVIDNVAFFDKVIQTGGPIRNCPAGGVYSLNLVGQFPTCSFTNEQVTWHWDRRRWRIVQVTNNHSWPN